MKPFWVYMLRCADSSYYIGHTDDLELRVAQHTSGIVPGYTSGRRPVVLVYATDFTSRDEARERELQLKGWSRRKKEALVREDWSGIQGFARGPDRVRPSTPARPSERTEQGGPTLRTNGEENQEFSRTSRRENTESVRAERSANRIHRVP